MSVQINNRKIAKEYPVYFIADIASNHGGDLSKAKELIYACKESRVDAVKMQNFTAETIVSDFGFKNLDGVETHQSKWKTSVFDSYKAASIPFEWTLELKELTDSLGMDYFTSPYSLELVKAVEPYVSAFKLGSGDITWLEEIEAMASYSSKSLLIATGASSLDDVIRAVNTALTKSKNILLMQCNTNYTARHGEPEALTRSRMSNLNLKVLDTYSKLWPKMPLGLSDHTHGGDSVLVAVGLYNCCAVEKHFTLDSSQEGQDHPFSMMPNEWLKMVKDTEHLKSQLNIEMEFDAKVNFVKRTVEVKEYVDLMIGDGEKIIMENERNTSIVQRRAIRANKKLIAGDTIKKEDLVVLRPCPVDAFPPYEMPELLGKKLTIDIPKGDYIKSDSFE